MMTLTDEEMKEKVKKLDDYRKNKPLQLTLFEWAGVTDEYSNSIDLYDFIPKYESGDIERINGQFLPPLNRNFEYKGKKYKVEIQPAAITCKDGIARYYYPGRREEIIEAVLRYFACQGKGMFFDDHAGVSFTLYDLQKELARHKHTYSRQQIKDALMICARTIITMFNEDGTSIVTSPLLGALGARTEENWSGSGKKTFYHFLFNPLVTASIKSNTYRQLNHDVSMSLTGSIEYRLHLRLSHLYTQASLRVSPFTILLSTLLRDFGLKVYDKLNNNLREVKKALEKLQAKNVILSYEIEPIRDPIRRNKFADAKIHIRTHPTFNSQAIAANAKHNENEKKLMEVKAR